MSNPLTVEVEWSRSGVSLVDVPAGWRPVQPHESVPVGSHIRAWTWMGPDCHHRGWLDILHTDKVLVNDGTTVPMLVPVS